jgi:glutaredoxin
MTDATSLRVYWQPGCSSCLKTKEFLSRHGLDFASINVRTEPGAAAELARLGARSIPVVARGDEFVYGQDLGDVARFIGVEPPGQRLPADVLVERLAALLRAAIRHTAQLPANRLETLLPGRADRAWIDLAYHPAMIVAGFLAAARGDRLEFEYFERRPQGAHRTTDAVALVLQNALADLEAWWSRAPHVGVPERVDTYYGERSLHSVLERTAWHVAQHCRQLESLVEQSGCVPDGPLGGTELAGLPLPEGLWDQEVR